MRLAVLSSDTMTPEQVGLYREILSGPRGQGPRAVLLDTARAAWPARSTPCCTRPTFGRALQELGAAIRFRTQLRPGSASRPSWSSPRPGTAPTSGPRTSRSAGMPGSTDPEIKALRAGAIPASPTSRSGSAYQVCRSLTGPADLDDDSSTTTRSPILGEAALVELSTLVGYYATLALQLRIFRVGAR